MSTDWRTQGEVQTIKVESPESSAPTPAKASAGEMARDVESRRGATPPPPRIAVLALHGMGQQIPFETLD